MDTRSVKWWAHAHLPDAFSPTSGRSRKAGQDLKRGRLASTTGNPRFCVRGPLSNRTVSPRRNQRGKTMCAKPTKPGGHVLGDSLGKSVRPPRSARAPSLQRPPPHGPSAWLCEHGSEARWTQRGVGIRPTLVNSQVSGDGVEWPSATLPAGVHQARARLPLARAVREALDATGVRLKQAPPVRRNRSEQSEGVTVP